VNAAAPSAYVPTGQSVHADLLGLVADFVFELDAEGRFTQLDAYGAKVLGHAPGVLLGRRLRDLVRSGEAGGDEETAANLLQALASQRDVEAWFECADGTISCLQLNAMPAQGSGLRGVARDITAQRAVEDDLSQSAQKLAMHVAQTPFGVIGFDREFRVTEWNPGAERIFGYTADEARGRRPAEIILDSDSALPVDEVWAALLAGARDQKSINENVTKSGETIVCEWHNTPLVDGSGQVIGVTSLCQDVTARIEQERALLAARHRADRANALKSEFLARLSHELRTPLHGILSFAQLGLRRAGSVPVARLAGYFEQIVDSGHRLEAMLVDLLDIGKLEVGRMTLRFEKHDFRAIVEACIAEQRGAIGARRIRLRTHWPEAGLPAVNCDRIRLGQVVVNLLGNALRHTPECGRIDITVTAVEVSGANMTRRSGLRFEIADTGRGIAEDELEHIFGTFARGRDVADVPGGSGLGLAIARELVTLHGGHIDACNNANGGATFGFSIPFEPPLAEPAGD